MRFIRVAAFMLVCVAGVAFSADEKKPDEKQEDPAKLIVGRWEVTKSDQGGIGIGVMLEFTKDGKAAMIAKRDGKELRISEWKYNVTGNNITLSNRIEEKRSRKSMKIVKISPTELITEDNNDVTVEFKKLPEVKKAPEKTPDAKKP